MKYACFFSILVTVISVGALIKYAAYAHANEAGPDPVANCEVKSPIRVFINGAVVPGNNHQTSTYGNQWAFKLAKDIGAKPFGYNEEGLAFLYILKALDTNGDKVITSAEANARTIEICGFSWGATNAIDLTWDLHFAQYGTFDTGGYTVQTSIPVKLLVTMDPVYVLNNPDPMQSNVISFTDIYESKGGYGSMWLTPTESWMSPYPNNPYKMGNTFSSLIHGEPVNNVNSSVQVNRINVTNDRTTTVVDKQNIDYLGQSDWNGSMHGGDVNHDTLPWYAYKTALPLF